MTLCPPPVIQKVLEKYKVIVPFRTVKPNDSWNLHKGVLPEHDNHDWIIIRDIIFREYPDLKAAFNKIAYSQIYFGLNMMITSKQIYDEYSRFVFDVLNKFDLEYEKEGKMRRARVDGFWSEQLLCIWVTGHFKESEIYWAHIGEAEKSYDNYYGNALSCKLKRMLCSNHFCFRLLKTIKLRVDFIKYKVNGKI